MSHTTMEQMPIWAPPTPPQDDNDLYVDYSMAFLYEQSVMTESQLPQVYIQKEAKRLRVEPGAAPRNKQKPRKDEVVAIPKSLFDRPSAVVLKLRKELKVQKQRGHLIG